MSVRKVKKFLILFLVISLLLPIFYLVFVKDRIYTVVEGRVYRSSRLSNKILEQQIKEKNIKTIVNLTGQSEDSQWYLQEKFIAQKYSIDLFDIKLDPNDLPEYRKLLKLLNILSTSRKPVLIHCLKGVDRAGFASAIALILEEDPPFSRVKEQFSWKYGVFPFYRSIGPYFFSEYEQWLKHLGWEHSKNTFLNWIEHEYSDNRGNLEFCIDHVAGIIFSQKKKKVTIAADSAKIVIAGWVFNKQTLSPPEELTVVIDNSISSKADFIYNRSDIARFFNLGDQYYSEFMIGWKAEFQRNIFSSDCHTISLRIIQKNLTRINIPTGREFCF